MTPDDLLRQYTESECVFDGYPYQWGHETVSINWATVGNGYETMTIPAIKDIIRERAGHRCARCGHPYSKGQHGNGEWSPCDEHCTHGMPLRVRQPNGNSKYMPGTKETILRHDTGKSNWRPAGKLYEISSPHGHIVEAEWRILTVHHLDEDKGNCRWWNLAALCQRCHLRMQRTVIMGRPWPLEHTEWFKPYAAGFYASKYLGEDLTKDEVESRLDELLAFEYQGSQEQLEGCGP